jgi:hypothetical protein
MVTMNYKKHDELPTIPPELAQECIEHATMLTTYKVKPIAWYWGYEIINENSVAYVKPGTELDETDGKVTAGIGFYKLPHNLEQKLLSFFRETNNPLINFDTISIQFASEGEFVLPHIDDPLFRHSGLLYLIKAGGANVTTSWYKIKPGLSLKDIAYNIGIPYSRLDLIESHRLEENAWHWLDFSEIHGIENKESLRVALWGWKS